MSLTGTDRGTGTHNTSALTFTLSPASNFTAGRMAVLVLSVDNADSSGAAHSTFTVTDTLGNTWTRRTSPLYDPGAAAAGVEGAIFTTPQNGGTIQTGTVITVTFDTNTTAKVWTIMEVSGSVGAVAFITGGVNTGSATAAPTVTTGSILSGDMVIGGLHNEHGTAQTVTGDADTTNGSWSTQQTAEIGTTAAGQSVSSQRKIVTNTAAQTFNPTLGVSSDVILSWIRVHEVVDTTVTPDVVALTVAPFAPTVIASDNQTVTPPTAALISATFEPTVSGQSDTIYVQDDFGRTVADGWSDADIGGAWTVGGGASDFDVASGVGTIVLPSASATRSADIAINLQDVDILLKVSTDKVAAGTTQEMWLTPRHVDGSNHYRLGVLFAVGGAVQWSIQRRIAGGSTILTGPTAASGLTHGAGTAFWIRAQVEGISPTTLRVKVWADGSSEPETWHSETTDSTSPLQAAAGVGLHNRVGSGVTNAPVTYSIDSYLAGVIPVAGSVLVTPGVASLTLSAFAPTVSVSPPGLYVAPSGSDLNSGTAASPWATITRASESVVPGDTVYLRGGTYNAMPGGYYSWQDGASGTALAPITVRNYPDEVPVLDGGMTVGQALMLNDVEYITVLGLTFQNYADTADAGEGVLEIRRSKFITVENCTFTDNGTNLWQDHAIYLNPGSSETRNEDITIRGCTFTDNTVGGGVHEFHDPGSLRLLVEDCTFSGNYWGVILDATCDFPTVQNNTFSTPISSNIEFRTGKVTNYTVTGNDPNDITWRDAEDITITPGVVNLVTATFAPTVTATAHQTITPDFAALVLTTFAPNVTAGTGLTLVPASASLTLTAFAPTVAISNHIAVTPPLLTLVLSAFAPTVTATAHEAVTPTTAALTLSPFAPTAVVSDNQVVTPPTATLVLTTYTPVIAAGVLVTPGLATLTLALFAPNVVLSDDQLVTPGAAALVLTSFAPVVTAFNPQLVTPAVVALILTTFAPTATSFVVPVFGHISTYVDLLGNNIETVVAPTVTNTVRKL